MPRSGFRRVGYVSAAAADDLRVAETTAVEILYASVRNNRRFGVTGALAATPDRFVQILEGGPVELDLLLDKIERDERHRDITVLFDFVTHQRAFSDWSMTMMGPGALAGQIARLGAGDADADIEHLELLEPDEVELLLLNCLHAWGGASVSAPVLDEATPRPFRPVAAASPPWSAGRAFPPAV